MSRIDGKAWKELKTQQLRKLARFGHGLRQSVAKLFVSE